MLSQAFNTKPYNDFDPNSFLIHYHGPKPHEYLSYLDTGKCDFFSLCEQAFLRSVLRGCLRVLVSTRSVATALASLRTTGLFSTSGMPSQHALCYCCGVATRWVWVHGAQFLREARLLPSY